MVTVTEPAPCPACGAPRLPEDQFCEACGASLEAAAGAAPDGGDPAATADPAPAGSGAALATTCPGCGGTAFADGYCATCGMRQPAARDHEERAGPGWAGVSDKGRRHHRNEDAFGVERLPDGRLAVIVCDGVSTTWRPDEASAAAVTAALADLADHQDGERGGPGGQSPPVNESLTGAELVAAGAAAQSAVVAVAAQGRPPGETAPDLGPPSCTLLAALLGGDAVEFGSQGDCRSYWLDGGGARQLTTDDSWAGEQVASGTLTAEQAMADERAHVITRWLGPDADPAWTPRLTTFEPPGPGRVVVCSDGLWNYLPDPADLAGAVGARTDLLDIARTLTNLANEAGGRDNITVVVVDWPLPPAGGTGPDGKDTP